MRHNLILTGDINLLGVTDPTIPFARVQEQLHASDNAQNKTIPRPLTAEQAELDQLRRLSRRFSTVLGVEGNEVVVWPQP
jgi:hypothetical protein